MVHFQKTEQMILITLPPLDVELYQSSIDLIEVCLADVGQISNSLAGSSRSSTLAGIIKEAW